MLEAGCDVKLPVAFPVGTIISTGFTLCADFLERIVLFYLKLACILLTVAFAAVLLISLCNMMDVKLLPPKRAQSVSQLWLAALGTVKDLVKASPKPAVELESGHCPAVQGRNGLGLQAMLSNT